MFAFRLEGSFKEVCWRDVVLQETPNLMTPKFCPNTWNKSHDVRTAKVVEKTAHRASSSRNHKFHNNDQVESTDETWKNIKDDENIKNLLNEKPSISCSRFYTNVSEYGEMTNNFLHKDSLQNVNSEDKTNNETKCSKGIEKF